jgi:aspartate aminotransferase
MQLSSLLQRFNEPETLKMAKLGREMRAKGIDVIDLSLGEPDFDTPQHIKEAAKKAIDENWSHYPPVAGYMDLRQAICDKLQRDNALIYTPENIIVSTGAKQSIANVILALLNAGDEVVIPTPYWVTYSALAQMACSKVVFIHTTADTGYKVTAAALERALTHHTKLFIFSSPCNPTGAVYTKEELKVLVDVFKKYPDVYILSDEIYEYINFTGNPHYSIAQFEALKERVIVVNGFSKGFAMTGWRLGYMAAPLPLAKACEKIQGQFTSGANTIAQRAAIAALQQSLVPTKTMVSAFAQRRAKVSAWLQQMPELVGAIPDGAFYIFPYIKKYLGKKYNEETMHNATDLCMYILNEAKVSTVTGSAFGNADCMRISFANSMENVEEGLNRIKHALSKLH